MPPDYKDDLELICEDIDDGELKHGQSPHDKYREYLIRKAPPQGFEGTYKVAFLAQEQFKGERKIERKAADGSVIKYSEYSKQYPIVVLKEFKVRGNSPCCTRLRCSRSFHSGEVGVLVGGLGTACRRSARARTRPSGTRRRSK